MFRVKSYAIFAIVLAGRFPTQVGDPIGFTVAVITRITCRFNQLLNDNIFWRIRRITHAKIDNVATSSAFLIQQSIDSPEHVRRQAVDTRSKLNFKR